MRVPERVKAGVPSWWGGGGGAAARWALFAAVPLEALFRVGTLARTAMYRRGILPVRRASIPVISVGNLTVGGTGKTPVSAWVAARLQAAGNRPAVVLREPGVDEALVHETLNPTIPVHAGRERSAAVEHAAQAGADCAVLDDGFQHLRLRRDLNIVLVAAEQWSPHPRLLPRGPWREPLSALSRADLVLVTRKVATPLEAVRVAAELGRWSTAPRAIAYLRSGAAHPIDGESPGAEVDLRGVSVLAVTSMAAPEAFVQQLKARGADVESARYADHHPFDAADIGDIERHAAGRAVVVSRKEAVKLRGRIPAGLRVLVVEQLIEFEDGEDAMRKAITMVMARKA